MKKQNEVNTKSLFELSMDAGMNGDTFTHQVMEAFCGIVLLSVEDTDVKRVQIEYGDKLLTVIVDEVVEEVTDANHNH